MAKTKLSAQQIQYIHENLGKKSMKDIAKELGVSYNTVIYHRNKGKYTNNGKWTEEEIGLLRKYAGHKGGINKISKQTGRSIGAIKQYAHKHNIRLKDNRLSWTDEEEKFLTKHVRMSIKVLALQLNKTPKQIRNKLRKMGLGDRTKLYTESTDDKISVQDFRSIMNVGKSKYLRWKRHGLPVITNKTTKPIISLKEALKWMKKHQDLFNASIIELNVFIPEPKWLIEKRKVDSNGGYVEKYVRVDYDGIRQLYLNGASYDEIKKMKGGCANSIYNATHSINTENKNKRYNREDIQFILDNCNTMSYCDIAKKLGRSVASINQMLHKYRKGELDVSKYKPKGDTKENS